MCINLEIDENQLEANCIFAATVGPVVIDLIKQMQSKIKKCQDENERIHQLAVAEQLFKNLGILGGYFNAIMEHGIPKELVFIDDPGNKIDLIQNRVLDENELVNIFLDNPQKP